MTAASRCSSLAVVVVVVVVLLAACQPRGSAAQPQRSTGVRSVPTAQRRADVALPLFPASSLFVPPSSSFSSSSSSSSRSSFPFGIRIPTPVARCVVPDGRPGHCVSTLTGFCAGYPDLPSLLGAGPSLCSQSGRGIIFCCPELPGTPADGPRPVISASAPLPAPVFTATSTRTKELTVTAIKVVTLRPTTTVTHTQLLTVDVTKVLTVEPTEVVAPSSPVTALLPVPAVNKVLTPPPLLERTTTTITKQPTTTPTTTSTTTTATTSATTTQTRRVAAGGCGSGGSGPWMMLVGSRDRWLCSGVLIGPRLVLTAARCVANRPLGSITVRLGESNLSFSSDGPVTDVAVQRAVLHPDRSGGRHDLALLQLSGPAPPGPPICMPAPALGRSSAPAGDSRPADIFVTLGWGISPLSVGRPAVKRLAVTPVRRVSAAACDASFRQFPTYLREFPEGVGPAELCVAAVRPDTPQRRCPVDRGSPLLSVDTDGTATLRGIGRLAAGCGSDVLPNVFINVEHYLPWIISVMEQL